jgi:hypothetical protein
MNHQTFYKLALIPIFACSASCVSTSQVLPVGVDTFTVSSTSDGLRGAAAARESAFLTGAEKCTSMGKGFELVNESQARTRMGIDTTVNVTFRCVKLN